MNKYTIKDSFPFAEEVLSYDPNLVMASFNVESHFTNIPLQKTIVLCVEILFQCKFCITGLTIKHFHELVIVTMSESLVSFDGNIISKLMELLWALHHDLL